MIYTAMSGTLVLGEKTAAVSGSLCIPQNENDPAKFSGMINSSAQIARYLYDNAKSNATLPGAFTQDNGALVTELSGDFQIKEVTLKGPMRREGDEARITLETVGAFNITLQGE